MRMKVLKGLVAVIVTLLVVFFLGAYLLPDQVVVERSVEIDRPQTQVFAVVNDLSRFNDWSPWYPMDPDAEYRYEGPETGVGAVLHWHGNEQIRTGSLRIVETQPPARVVTEVDFGATAEPARSEQHIEALSDSRSRVRWTFTLNLDGPFARWFGLLMPRHIGADYDRGLAGLKRLLETEPVEDFSDLAVSEEVVSSQDVIAVAGVAPVGDMAAVSAELGARYGELLAYAERHDLELVGRPLTLTMDPVTEQWRFLAALPVRASGPVPSAGGIELLRTRSGPALVVEHVGPYHLLNELRSRLEGYARAHGQVRDGAVQEIYVSDPATTSEERLLTRLIYPIRSNAP